MLDHAGSGLAEAVENARLEERRELSYLLHDTVAQNLVALKLGLLSLKRSVAASTEASAGVAELDALLTATIEKIRNLTVALHPDSLERSGFEAALRDHVAAFAHRFGIATEFRVTADMPALGGRSLVVLLRTAREALTNVVKHAEATRVWITLERLDAPPRLRLTVEDDGRGIDGRERAANSIGLVGLKEQLARCGGSLDVATRAPRGTALWADVPLSGD